MAEAGCAWPGLAALQLEHLAAEQDCLLRDFLVCLKKQKRSDELKPQTDCVLSTLPKARLPMRGLQARSKQRLCGPGPFTLDRSG